MIQFEAAAFPRRAPGWPLLAVLGLHLLLAWSWRVQQAPAGGAEDERMFILMPVPPPALALPEVAPAPPRMAAPRTRSAAAAAIHAPEPVIPPVDTPVTGADPFAITAPAPAPPGEPALDAMAGRALRDAGRIDRELHKGKPGVPINADTAASRFTSALEAAHVETSRNVVTDTYIAPDGQIIYRVRQGGRVECRTSGSVGPRIGGAEGGGQTLFDTRGGGGAAGKIRCPSHGQWKRD